MNLYTLPQSLYGLEGIKEILSHEENAILYKKLDEDLLNKEKLITAHSIVYVLNGKVSISTYDGEEFCVKNGEMLFMPRDSYLISDYIREGKSMEVYLLFFDHDIVIKFLDGFQAPRQNTSSICKLEVTENVRYYFENIERMHFDDPHNKNLLSVKLLEFLHLISEQESFKLTLDASERGKQKRDIELLMLEHYDKNISIANFAALSGRSLSTFNRAFKQKHNKTPKKWLIEKKMHLAFTFLKEGKSVTQSAFDVGYLNVSNFIKAYKEVYGETPKTTQKNLL